MSLDIITHKIILVKILKAIFSDVTLGSSLGFKGGTAALLFYGLNRFSVDLDFNLLDPKQEDNVFTTMNKLLERFGSVKEAHKKHFTLFYLLAYSNKARDAQNIKVEISRRHIQSRYAVLSYLGIPMKVMVQDDMAAHKLIAMSERMHRATRDIFDVHFFLNEHWPINIKLIEERTGLPWQQFLQHCIELLEKIDNKNILAGLGELLDEKQKIWVKAHLKEDTLFLLKLQLEQIR